MYIYVLYIDTALACMYNYDKYGQLSVLMIVHAFIYCSYVAYVCYVICVCIMLVCSCKLVCMFTCVCNCICVLIFCE